MAGTAARTSNGVDILGQGALEFERKRDVGGAGEGDDAIDDVILHVSELNGREKVAGRLNAIMRKRIQESRGSMKTYECLLDLATLLLLRFGRGGNVEAALSTVLELAVAERAGVLPDRKWECERRARRQGSLHRGPIDINAGR